MNQIEDTLITLNIDNQLSVDCEYEYLNGQSIIRIDNEISNKKIGYIAYKIYNTNLISSAEYLFDVADSISGDEVYIIENFLECSEKNKLSLKNKKILSLDTMKVKKKYRSLGHGRSAMTELIKLCKVLDVDYIVLKPAPIEGKLESRNREAMIRRLISFYSSLGFQTYQIEDDEPIMYLVLEEFDYSNNY